MPRFKPFHVDGSTYVLKADRDLPDAEQVKIRHRDPLPLEIAEIEQNAGRFVLGEGGRVSVAPDGSKASELGAGSYWISHGPTNSIKALLRFVLDVTGPGPEAAPLVYPKDGTDEEKQRFWACWDQADLYEIAEHILERRGHLTEGERGN